MLGYFLSHPLQNHLRVGTIGGRVGMAYTAQDDFDIAEEVARGLMQRETRGLQQIQTGFSENVMINSAPFDASDMCSLETGSYESFQKTMGHIENPYASITMTATTNHRHWSDGSASETSPPKRSNVGRKPPKGPDGVLRYSSRRATVERRDRINSRERDRMHQLCDAFERLRQVLPCKRLKQGPQRQKFSKIGTLLMAQNYIRTLEEILSQPAEEPAVSVDTTAFRQGAGGENVATGGGYVSVTGTAVYSEEMTTMQYSFCADLASTNIPQNYYTQPLHHLQYQCL